jgi:general stress protein 26
MVEGGVELINRVRTKGVANLWSIERDANRALVDSTVIGDVSERKAGNFAPRSGIKNRRNAHPDIVSCGVVSLKLMAQWSHFESENPELARKVRLRFESHAHHILGTIDASGAPRLSGLNVFFNDGEVWFGSMSGARKVADMKRDPRISLHSATLSEQLEGGDARISGFARVLDAQRAALWRPENPTAGEFFTIDIRKVHLVEVSGEQLRVSMWDTERGLRIVHRQ